MTGNRSEMVDIADRITRQAECLEGYAEQAGHHAKPVPSVFHSQAAHFRDLANELRAAAPNQPLSDSVERALLAELEKQHLPYEEAQEGVIVISEGAIDIPALARAASAAGGVETLDLGASSGSRPSDQAPTGLGGSRFDPARWQPIETAPDCEDGVLICDATKPNPAVGQARLMGDGKWWGASLWGGFVGEAVWPSPTHWMPLPEPPESAGQ